MCFVCLYMYSVNSRISVLKAKPSLAKRRSYGTAKPALARRAGHEHCGCRTEGESYLVAVFSRSPEEQGDRLFSRVHCQPFA